MGCLLCIIVPCSSVMKGCAGRTRSAHGELIVQRGRHPESSGCSYQSSQDCKIVCVVKVHGTQVARPQPSCPRDCMGKL